LLQLLAWMSPSLGRWRPLCSEQLAFLAEQMIQT
jgi:hypothetical protein